MLVRPTCATMTIQSGSVQPTHVLAGCEIESGISTASRATSARDSLTHPPKAQHTAQPRRRGSGAAWLDTWLASSARLSLAHSHGRT